jgi:hypothetical protein
MFHCLNYDEWSEGQVSITEEQRQFEPIKAQLRIPNHTTYAGPRPTYINLHSDPPKRQPVCATRKHITPPPYVIPDVSAGWVHATLAISHSQCAIVFSHDGIAEVLGLLEYVAGTAKSQPQ